MSELICDGTYVILQVEVVVLLITGAIIHHCLMPERQNFGVAFSSSQSTITASARSYQKFDRLLHAPSY
ncbi:hypothetical protein MRX96_018705 [Rhipicephalus microplus]